MALPLPALASLLATAAYLTAARRAGVGWPRRTAFAAGAVICAACSSYDATSLVDHMVQHGALSVVAAPLLVAGEPAAVVAALVPLRTRLRILRAAHRGFARLLEPPCTIIVFVAAQWAANDPMVVAYAESHPVAHVADHLLLVGASVLLFLAILGHQPLPRRVTATTATVSLLITMPLVDAIGVAYLVSGRADAGVAMIASMLPLGLIAVGVAWHGLVAEERRATRREAVT